MLGIEPKTNDLWVFVEAKEDGSARNVGIELLNPGREMADKQKGKLIAIVIGKNISATVESASKHGVDGVIYIDSEEYKEYSTDAYTDAIQYLIEKYGPGTMLIGATSLGRDLGPRIACRLGTGLTADCTSLDIDEETGNVAWTRPAFGGNLMATILCPDHRPQMGTVRPGVFKKPGETEACKNIIKEDYHVAPERIRTRIIEIIKDVGDENVDLESAEILVSGGFGVGGPEGFVTIKALADAIGGTVASSRAAVDSGWIGHTHQVGQTGKTVSPKLYIACGISGAIQHIAGMSGSDVVVAINKDEEAPIFSVSDYGVVGDLFEIIPALIKEIEKKK